MLIFYRRYFERVQLRRNAMLWRRHRPENITIKDFHTAMQWWSIHGERSSHSALRQLVRSSFYFSFRSIPSTLGNSFDSCTPIPSFPFQLPLSLEFRCFSCTLMIVVEQQEILKDCLKREEKCGKMQIEK